MCRQESLLVSLSATKERARRSSQLFRKYARAGRAAVKSTLPANSVTIVASTCSKTRGRKGQVLVFPTELVALRSKKSFPEDQTTSIPFLVVFLPKITSRAHHLTGV